MIIVLKLFFRITFGEKTEIIQKYGYDAATLNIAIVMMMFVMRKDQKAKKSMVDAT